MSTLPLRLVRMRCCHCGGERGAELPRLFLDSACVLQPLFCTWCSRARPHTVVGPGKHHLIAAAT